MNTPIVVKFGGSNFGPNALAPFADAVAKLAATRSVLVVHGGGKDITTQLAQLGLEGGFVDGLRVTDDQALEVVEQVLSGKVNKRIVRALARAGVSAVGIAGTDAGLLKAVTLQKVVGTNGSQHVVTWGRVGEIHSVDATLIRYLWTADYVPVVSPLATGEDGEALNVNADMAAAALAADLGAELRLLTDVAGILDPEGDVIGEADAETVAQLKQTGVVTGGMIPKVDACLEAVAKGAPASVIQSLQAFVLGGTKGSRIVK